MVEGAAQGPLKSPSKVGLQEETSVLTRQVSSPELSGSLCKRHPSFLTCPKKSLGYRIKTVYLAAFNFEAIGRIVIPPALILTNYGNKG